MGAKSLQLALPLASNHQITVHVHLTFSKTNTLILLTTTTTGDSGALTAMGSFVYAMPNRLNPQNIPSTTFYSSEDTIDHASRIAKILAQRMNVPVYVGCSMKLSGLMVEEQLGSLRELAEVIMEKWNQDR